jgi:hypothetical protein
MDNFTVTLVSNIDTQGAYDDINRRSSFITPFEVPFDLTEGWEVCVKDVYIPNYIDNVGKWEALFEIAGPVHSSLYSTISLINAVRARLGMKKLDFLHIKDYIGRGEDIRLNDKFKSKKRRRSETDSDSEEEKVIDQDKRGGEEQKHVLVEGFKRVMGTDGVDGALCEGVKCEEYWDRTGAEVHERGEWGPHTQGRDSVSFETLVEAEGGEKFSADRPFLSLPANVVKQQEEKQEEEEEESERERIYSSNTGYNAANIRAYVPQDGFTPADIENVVFKRGRRDRQISNCIKYRSFALPPGTYTPQTFVEAFNNEVATVAPTFSSRLGYSQTEKKFTFDMGPGESIQISPKNLILKEMMGFSQGDARKNFFINSHNLGRKKIALPYQSYFMHDSEVAILYCSIVDPSIMGGSSVKYLRTVNLADRSAGDSELVHRNYNDGQYFPCARTMVPRIEIELRTQSGRLLRIQKGTTTVVLHFRRQRRWQK